jgi:hypothetical protein
MEFLRMLRSPPLFSSEDFEVEQVPVSRLALDKTAYFGRGHLAVSSERGHLKRFGAATCFG